MKQKKNFLENYIFYAHLRTGPFKAFIVIIMLIYSLYTVIIYLINSIYIVIMMKKFKQLQLNILDRHLENIHICERPSDGWIRSIRKAIGMSARQLAERIGITQQSTSRLEENELDDSITLKTLRRAAEAMNCRLLYAIVPYQGSLEDIIKQQAYKKAKEIVEPVNHTMLLEAQEVGDLKDKIAEVSDELAKNLNSRLWNQ